MLESCKPANNRKIVQHNSNGFAHHDVLIGKEGFNRAVSRGQADCKCAPNCLRNLQPHLASQLWKRDIKNSLQYCED
ncbi:Hypothetical predicted protein [Cloeon dipterum]|uniref:Uncharacterized protein n=1 Tax=Cloeon dipterum TaxID=197152 RepID=A0A8S1DK00_9INSE|nr:Hypothetical predicted protein [Cloeon dipterum]